MPENILKKYYSPRHCGLELVVDRDPAAVVQSNAYFVQAKVFREGATTNG